MDRAEAVAEAEADYHIARAEREAIRLFEAGALEREDPDLAEGLVACWSSVDEEAGL